MEDSNTPRTKGWLKTKFSNNGRQTDASSPLLSRRSPSNNNSPRMSPGCSLDDDVEWSQNHAHVLHQKTSTRTRPVRRSNTTGASPRAVSAALNRCNRNRESAVASAYRNISNIEGAHNYAGDLFVGEEELISLQRIRNFTTKDGSLVNRGDSFRIKKGASGSKGGLEGSPESTKREGEQVSVESILQVAGNFQQVEKKELLKYEILVLGGSGVGKSTLIQQMMTSLHLAADDSYGQHISQYGSHGEVIVKVNQFEVILKFLNASEFLQQQHNLFNNNGDDDDAKITHQQDHNHHYHHDLELIKNSQSAVSGYLVVYSVTDQSSFRHAQACLHELRPDKRRNLVILVANKNDLVRNRVISEEDGMRLATRKQCKYIDLSALLNHKIDDLLVGIARQIHLRQLPPSKMWSRVYFDEDGNHIFGDEGLNSDDDDVELFENKAHQTPLQSESSQYPRFYQKLASLKPFFVQPRIKFNPVKFQSRVGSLVLGLFKKKKSHKSLTEAFSGHTHAMTSIFPGGVGVLKSRCDDLMNP